MDRWRLIKNDKDWQRLVGALYSWRSHRRPRRPHPYPFAVCVDAEGGTYSASMPGSTITRFAEKIKSLELEAMTENVRRNCVGKGSK